MKSSCKECPFFRERDKRSQVAVVGSKALPIAVTYTFDTCALGASLTLTADVTSSRDDQLERIAKACHVNNSGGNEGVEGDNIATQPRVVKRVEPPNWAEPKASWINPEADLVADDTWRGGTVNPVPTGTLSSCRQCAFFIPTGPLLEAGLAVDGACAKRGIALAPEAITANAPMCDQAAVGPSDPAYLDNDGVILLADGLVGVKMESIVEDAVRSTAPESYQTDRDVSDEDKARGIKAWRKIANPADESLYVNMPIYDENYFEPSERELIPRTGDDEHPEDYVDHHGVLYRVAIAWFALDETPALWGVAGTGKTEFFRYAAWLMGLPFHRVSITASTEIDDLAGKMHYSPEKGTYFQYGRVPAAWQKPGVICIDEPNVGSPEVWQFIRPLTDNSKQLVLDMNNGERVSRHANAFLGMAMNPAWDARNSGTLSLADADGSRLAHVSVTLPDRDIEEGIIRRACQQDDYKISKEHMDMLMSVAKELRTASEADTLSITWGLRPQIKVARALRWLTPMQAYSFAALDYLDPEESATIRTIISSHLGRTKEPARKPRSRPTMRDVPF